MLRCKAPAVRGAERTFCVREHRRTRETPQMSVFKQSPYCQMKVTPLVGKIQSSPPMLSRTDFPSSRVTSG